MNYCPNCGTQVESFWKVCANCSHKLSIEDISTIAQKEPDNQTKIVEPVTPKPSYTYFKPKKNVESLLS